MPSSCKDFARRLVPMFSSVPQPKKKYFISVHDIAGSAEATKCADDLITAEDSLEELNRKINEPSVRQDDDGKDA